MIETDLGFEDRTDMRWRPNVGDERQELALADGSQWRRPCLELGAESESRWNEQARRERMRS